MNKLLSALVAFMSGGIIMIFELVGTRVMAPFFGNSLVVWTNIIGVILGSLSLGYYLGGILADWRMRKTYLSGLLFYSSLSIVVSLITSLFIVEPISHGITSLIISSFICAFILFVPTGVLFGMITPYLVRLNLSNIDNSGKIIGNLYSISTLGSISGTFTAGFILIPVLGSNMILLCSGVMMFILSLLCAEIRLFKGKLALMLSLIIIYSISNLSWRLSHYNLVADIDSQYARYLVYDGIDSKKQKEVRYLITDPLGVQSAVYRGDLSELALEYQEYYRIYKHFNPEAKRGLLIGGGAYSMARDFIGTSSDATIDVVEIDPEMDEIAKEFFWYTPDDRIAVINEDGRRYLNINQTKYDCIFIDAFSAGLVVPFHLTTKEAFTEMNNSLNEEGIVVFNMISALTGDKSRFYQSELNTLKGIFSEVLTFQVNSLIEYEKPQNIIIMAMKDQNSYGLSSDNDKLNWYLSHRIEEPEMSMSGILTDDYSPTDYFAMSLQ